MAPLSGGMEHQAMTTQGFFEKTLTAHELAHQWWGDHVTCASWADIWVNEGFASYAEYLMLEEMYPAEKAADMMTRHNNIRSEIGGSIRVLDSLDGNRIFDGRLTYDKGAAFIHTLRYEINNDSLFLLGLRNFQENYSYSSALGIDVQQALENVSGKDLSAIFEQWYFGEGFPTYSAKWNVVGTNLYVNVSQTTSMPSVTPFFTNNLDLKFQRTGLSDTIIRFDIQGINNNFTIPNLGTITNLSASDPLNWIVNNNGTIQHDLALDFTGIENLEQEELITLSPNPSSDFVELKSKSTEIFTIKIIDTKGKLCFEKQLKTGDKINVSEFQSGLYLFQIESQNGNQISRKIVRR